MDRQTFLGTLVALPVGLFLVSCSSSTSDAPAAESTDPAAAPTHSGSSTTYTSSVAFSHSHTVALDDVTIVSAAAFDGTTSMDDNHDHMLAISSQELAQVAAGQSVKVTTVADNSGHTHVFTIVKIA